MKRKASRKLLFPAALAPTSKVSAPKSSVARAKFLKLCSSSVLIMASSTGLDHHDTQLYPAYLSDRKSTRLNSSHTVISYAVFCLKNKTRRIQPGTYRA